MGLIRAGWNITAMLVGLLVLPLGYVMIMKPMRGLMVTVLMIIVAICTGGVGLVVAYPLALLDILTGGKLG